MRYAFIKSFGEEKAIYLANIAIIVSLAYFASLWVNLFISNRYAETPRYDVSRPTISPAPLKKADYSIIKSRGLFKSNVEKTSPSAELASVEVSNQEKPVSTKLNLKLMGTIITDSGGFRIAVIEKADKRKQELYYLNDTVAPGAKLVRIDRFQVLIDNNGQIELLEAELAKNSSDARMRQRKSRPQTSAPFSGGKVFLDKRFLDKQLGNLDRLMVEVRAFPHKNSEGVIDGFLLNQIVKNSIYDKIGLKNKDIIQQVNSQKLDSIEGGLDLFMALKNETHFEIDLLRGGVPETITVDIR